MLNAHPTGGVALLFQRGGVWRETVGLEVSAPDVTIADYGAGEKPTFTAFSDPGVATIGKQKNLPLDFQLVLNPNIPAGDYSVTSEAPQLIMDRNKLADRQVLEI